MSATDIGTAVLVYRIATEAPAYRADDLTGVGAKQTGGRWNACGVPVVYASSSRALACLETVVHRTNGSSLPLNRYLIEVAIPPAAWSARTRFSDDASTIGWDAQSPGGVSIDWGTRWLNDRSSVVAVVPSVIVPEESNLLLNPLHPDVRKITARMVRKWTYDRRMTAGES